MDVKTLRLITGLSQTEFAKQYQIPKTTLQHWEQGTMKPSEYVLLMLERLISEIDHVEEYKKYLQ